MAYPSAWEVVDADAVVGEASAEEEEAVVAFAVAASVDPVAFWDLDPAVFVEEVQEGVHDH